MKKMKFLILSSALVFVTFTTYGQEHRAELGPEPVISGVIDGHEYADLGFESGTLWATCNVGAESRGEIGIQVAWGETEPKDYYYWETYKYYEYDIPQYGEVHCTDLGKEISGTEYDAARVHWGPKWEMPTIEQFAELRYYCWWLLVEEDGASGYRMFGPNRNSIFLPFTNGYKLVDGSQLPNAAAYWSGTEFDLQAESPYLPDDANSEACAFYFDTGGLNPSRGTKVCGCAIRAVVNRDELASIGTLLTEDDACVSYKNGMITLHANAKVKQVDVWSVNGVKVLSVANPEKTVDANNIAQGVYVVRLTGDNRIIRTQKIIIK